MDNIIQYCAYCKDPVSEDEESETKGDEIYHSFCLKQKNTYCDAFGSNEDIDNDIDN